MPTLRHLLTPEAWPEVAESMETLKAHVRRDKSALVECPFCGSSRVVDPGKFKSRARPLKVICVCRKEFHVLFEWRGALRKETYLEGYYSKLSSPKEWSRMLIKDISSTGIRFATFTMHNLREGDRVIVRFALNNRSRPETKKNAIVKRIMDENHIGCAFEESS